VYNTHDNEGNPGYNIAISTLIFLCILRVLFFVILSKNSTAKRSYTRFMSASLIKCNVVFTEFTKGGGGRVIGAWGGSVVAL